MLHENLKETKLLQGQLKWLAAPPNPDGLPIEKEFTNDDQGLKGWLWRVDYLIRRRKLLLFRLREPVVQRIAPAPRTVRIGSCSRPGLSNLRNRPVCTSTVRSSM